MAKDEKKPAPESRKRGKLAQKPDATPKRGPAQVPSAKPKRGLNKLPGYLRRTLGLHDMIASSLIIVGGGLAMTLLVWFLSIVWPG